MVSLFELQNKDETSHGFCRGKEPEKILGATNSSGELYYVMKWLVFSYFSK